MCSDVLKPSYLNTRLSEGVLNIMFKSSIDFIQILFNEHVF